MHTALLHQFCNNIQQSPRAGKALPQISSLQHHIFSRRSPGSKTSPLQKDAHNSSSQFFSLNIPKSLCQIPAVCSLIFLSPYFTVFDFLLQKLFLCLIPQRIRHMISPVFRQHRQMPDNSPSFVSQPHINLRLSFLFQHRAAL